MLGIICKLFSQISETYICKVYNYTRSFMEKKMVLYLSIIIISTLLIGLFNALFAAQMLFSNTLEIFAFTALAVIVSILLDGLCAYALRQIPERKLNHESFWFKERAWERKFYEKTLIRKWKDIIPELGGVLKYFDKSHVKPQIDSKYIKKFIAETCYGEIMHLLAIFVAPAILFILPPRFLLTVSLPVLVVNILLQIPPIMVQRYNRPKLVLAYKRLRRTEEREVVQEQHTKN